MTIKQFSQLPAKCYCMYDATLDCIFIQEISWLIIKLIAKQMSREEESCRLIGQK